MDCIDLTNEGEEIDLTNDDQQDSNRNRPISPNVAVIVLQEMIDRLNNAYVDVLADIAYKETDQNSSEDEYFDVILGPEQEPEPELFISKNTPSSQLRTSTLQRINTSSKFISQNSNNIISLISPSFSNDTNSSFELFYNAQNSPLIESFDQEEETISFGNVLNEKDSYEYYNEYEDSNHSVMVERKLITPATSNDSEYSNNSFNAILKNQIQNDNVSLELNSDNSVEIVVSTSQFKRIKLAQNHPLNHNHSIQNHLPNHDMSDEEDSVSINSSDNETNPSITSSVCFSPPSSTKSSPRKPTNIIHNNSLKRNPKPNIIKSKPTIIRSQQVGTLRYVPENPNIIKSKIKQSKYRERVNIDQEIMLNIQNQYPIPSCQFVNTNLNKSLKSHFSEFRDLRIMIPKPIESNHENESDHHPNQTITNSRFYSNLPYNMQSNILLNQLSSAHTFVSNTIKKYKSIDFSYLGTFKIGSGSVNKLLFTNGPEPHLISGYVVSGVIYGRDNNIVHSQLKSGHHRPIPGKIKKHEPIQAHYSLRSGEQNNSLGSIYDMCISRDFYASCSEFNSKVNIWDIRNGNLIGALQPGSFCRGIMSICVPFENDDEGNQIGIVTQCSSNSQSGACYIFTNRNPSETHSVIWADEKYKESGTPSIYNKAFDGTHCTFGKNASKNRFFGSFQNSDQNFSDGKICCWDIATKTPIFSQYYSSLCIERIRLSTNGQLYACAMNTKYQEQARLLLMDIRVHPTNNNPGILKEYKTLQKDQNDVGFSPDGNCIYSIGTENIIEYVDIRSPKYPLHVLKHSSIPKTLRTVNARHEVGVRNALWTQSGYLISGGEDCQVRIWDVKRGNPYVKSLSAMKCLDKNVLDGPVMEIALSPDEQFLAAGTDTGRMYVWTTDSVHQWKIMES